MKAGFTRGIADKPKLVVAAYIRVSTSHPDQENSYAVQEHYFNRLLTENKDWICAGIYSDYGVSGTQNKTRTGFRRILRHCKMGRIDLILCKSISRFARNTGDFLEALAVLKQCGAAVYFEKERLDTSDPGGEFILTTLGAIAQEESRSISENIRWSYIKRCKTGEAKNVPIYGYRYADEIVVTKTGYRLRSIEPVPEEAAIVRRIFKSAANGKSFAAIARELNRENIPPPETAFSRKRREQIKNGTLPDGALKAELKKGWNAGQLSRMVRLERYVGDILLQKQYTVDYLKHSRRRNKGELPQYLIYNHHPAIISRELFEQVQDVLNTKAAGKRVRGGNRPHSFSGRLICGGCGRYYTVRSCHGKAVWYCPTNAQNNGMERCCNESVKEERLMTMLRKAFAERFLLKDHDGFITRLGLWLKDIDKDDFNRDELYLRKLEESGDSRNEAVKLLDSLSDKKAGAEKFLNNLSDCCIKSFVFSVTILSPLSYKVRWFDNAITQVRLNPTDE